jgi:hypothetical protein
MAQLLITFKEMWKEEVVSYFTVLYQHFPGKNEKIPQKASVNSHPESKQGYLLLVSQTCYNCDKPLCKIVHKLSFHSSRQLEFNASLQSW